MNKIIYLVTVDYEDGEPLTHNLFEIPEARLDEAGQCVKRAKEKALAEDSEYYNIWSLIEAELKKADIPYKYVEYSSTHLSL